MIGSDWSYIKKIKSKGFEGLLPPRDVKKLRKMWNDYQNLANQIDLSYEEDIDPSDLEEEAERLHVQISSMLEEIDQGADEHWFGGEEVFTQLGTSLDEELTRLYQALVLYEDKGIPSHFRATDWLKGVKDTIETHLWRDILEDTKGNKSERIEKMRDTVAALSFEEANDVAEEAYLSRLEYWVKQRGRYE